MGTLLLLLMLVVEIASLINSEDTQPGEFPFMVSSSPKLDMNGHY